MLLPEVHTQARIRFENPRTKETCFTNMTVTESSYSVVAGEPITLRLEGFLNRGPMSNGTLKRSKEDGIGIAERVIFNPPATIAIWKDGSKTVVKCDEKDEYDPRYGLALCYMKKALGNTSRGLNDAMRAGYDELEKPNKKKNKHLDEVRNFLKTKTVRDDFERSRCCPVGPLVNTTCGSCPYDYLPYEKCTDCLKKDIIKIRKQDADGGEKR